MPGDVITAIIIGAFMIHGLQPGPMMFIANGDIIYALFLGLIISSILLMGLCSVVIRLFRYIADILGPFCYRPYLSFAFMAFMP